MNMFANARSEHIDILLRCLYLKSTVQTVRWLIWFLFWRIFFLGYVTISLFFSFNLLTSIEHRNVHRFSMHENTLSMRNESKPFSEFARVSYDMILHCISLLDVLLRSSRIGSEAVYNGVLSSGVASALSDMNIFKTLSRVRMYECQYGRYDVTVRYLRLLTPLRHMKKCTLLGHISSLEGVGQRWDSSISSQELKEGLVRMGLMISDDALRRLVARFDRDGDDSIDYGELIRFIQKRTHRRPHPGKKKNTMRSSAQIARDRWQNAKTNAFMDTEETDRLVEDELDSFFNRSRNVRPCVRNDTRNSFSTSDMWLIWWRKWVSGDIKIVCNDGRSHDEACVFCTFLSCVNLCGMHLFLQNTEHPH